MRALVLTCLVLWSAPAVAQEIYCESVVEGEAGEFIAGYTLGGKGEVKSSLFSWMPPRDKYESFDAKFMSSPRLMLHYRMKGDSLAGPSGIDITTTMVSTPRDGGASPLSQIEVEAVVSPSGSRVMWKGSERSKGQPKLAELLRRENPSRVSIKLRERNKVTANAEFDLGKRGAIDPMAVKARAQADQLVAKTKQMLAEGKKLRDCAY